MTISGSYEFPLVFSPEHNVRKALVRVIDDLHYSLVTGAAFMTKQGSNVTP